MLSGPSYSDPEARCPGLGPLRALRGRPVLRSQGSAATGALVGLQPQPWHLEQGTAAHAPSVSLRQGLCRLGPALGRCSGPDATTLRSGVGTRQVCENCIHISAIAGRGHANWSPTGAAVGAGGRGRVQRSLGFPLSPQGPHCLAQALPGARPVLHARLEDGTMHPQPLPDRALDTAGAEPQCSPCPTAVLSPRLGAGAEIDSSQHGPSSYLQMPPNRSHLIPPHPGLPILCG